MISTERKKNPCILWSTGTDERVWWQIFFCFLFYSANSYTYLHHWIKWIVNYPSGGQLPSTKKNRKHNIFTILHHSFTKKQWKIPAHSHIVIKTNEWPSQKLVSCKIPYLSSTHSPIFFNWTLNKKVRLLFFLFFSCCITYFTIIINEEERRDLIGMMWCDGMAYTHNRVLVHSIVIVIVIMIMIMIISSAPLYFFLCTSTKKTAAASFCFCPTFYHYYNPTTYHSHHYNNIQLGLYSIHLTTCTTVDDYYAM